MLLHVAAAAARGPILQAVALGMLSGRSEWPSATILASTAVSVFTVPACVVWPGLG